MKFTTTRKRIQKINRRIEHHNSVLETLVVGKDREDCLHTIARLSILKMELEKKLELEKTDFKLRILKALVCTFSMFAVVVALFSVLLICGDKEAEIQRNKLANHRIEQASLER